MAPLTINISRIVKFASLAVNIMLLLMDTQLFTVIVFTYITKFNSPSKRVTLDTKCYHVTPALHFKSTKTLSVSHYWRWYNWSLSRIRVSNNKSTKNANASKLQNRHHKNFTGMIIFITGDFMCNNKERENVNIYINTAAMLKRMIHVDTHVPTSLHHFRVYIII